jgi:ribonuclease P/MRP protein subunit RPP40
VGSQNPCLNYTIGDVPLQTVEQQRDLGIILTSQWKCSAQATRASSKANQMLGCICRTFVSRRPAIQMPLFKSLVRPHLEFCCPAWDVHLKRELPSLESPCRRFTRLFPWLRKSRDSRDWASNLLKREDAASTSWKFTRPSMDPTD